MIDRLARLAPAGSLVRTVTAIAFPSVALLDDRQPILGILLYLAEILLSAVLLLTRSSASVALASRAARRATVEGGDDVLALRKARDLASTTLGVGLLGVPFLLIAVLLAAPDTEWAVLVATIVDRVRWMALIMLGSAVLDVLVVPLRTPEWLHGAVRRQMTRTILLHPVVLFGFLIFGITGTFTGMVVIFVGVRLLLDLRYLLAR